MVMGPDYWSQAKMRNVVNENVEKDDLSTRTPPKVTTTRLRLRVPKQGTNGILGMVWMKFQTLNFGKNSSL